MSASWEKALSVRCTAANPVEKSGSSYETSYVVDGETNEGNAIVVVKAIAPATYLTALGETLIRQAFDAQPLATDAWEVKVKYTPESDDKNDQKPEDGTWKFSWDTTGGQHKIAQSLQTIWKGQCTGSSFTPAPDLGGAIEWDGKKVNGVEIVVPKLEFTITAYYDPVKVTTNKMRDLARKTGRTNNDTWLGFDPGELLFLGSTAQGDIPTVAGQKVNPIPITYKYAASENRTNIQIGCITVPSKKGWEYLWVYYEKTEASNLVIPQPKWAYVEKVYDDLAFGAFFGFP